MLSRTSTTNNNSKKIEPGDDRIYDTSLGIDIGSMFVRAVVTKNNKIIKRYKISSEGVEYGLIVDTLALEEKISVLVSKIAKDFRPFPENVMIGISSLDHTSIEIGISVFTRRSDGLVTEDDMDHAIEEAKRRLDLGKNKIILHSAIIWSALDDNEVRGSPVGMNGYKIDFRILFIIDNIKMQNDINNIFNNLKIPISDIVSGPLAESVLGMGKKDKRIGGAIINIGAHNTSIVVYENNNPILCKIIKLGGENITNDLALALRVPHEEAENIKLGDLTNDYSKRRIEEISESRYDYIGIKINEELSKIEREGALPSGVYLIGGGTKQKKIEQYLKHRLKLPAVYVRDNDNRDIFDFEYDEYLRAFAITLLSQNDKKVHAGVEAFSKIFNSFMSYIKKYLP